MILACAENPFHFTSVRTSNTYFLKTQLPLEQNRWMMYFSSKNMLVGFFKPRKSENLVLRHAFWNKRNSSHYSSLEGGITMQNQNAGKRIETVDSLWLIFSSTQYWTAAHMQPICPNPKASYQEIIQRQCMSFSWESLKDPKPKLSRLWKSAALLKGLWSMFLDKTTVKWTMMGWEARIFVKQGLAGLNKVTLILTWGFYLENEKGDQAIILFLATPDGHVYMHRINYVKIAIGKSRH